MKLPKFLHRAIQIVFHSKQEWNNIAQEYFSSRDLFMQYVLPWIILCTSLSALCSGIYSNHFWAHFFLTLLLGGISYIGGYFLACYLGFYLLNKLFPKAFNKQDTITIISYAFTVYWALECVVAIVPEFLFLRVLNFYILYVLWEADGVLMEIPKQKQGVVVLPLAVLIVVAVPIIRALSTILLPNVHL